MAVDRQCYHGPECTLCTNFIRAHSLLTLAASPVRRFFHRRHRPAVQREKIRRRQTRLRTRLSKWRGQRENFERERGELPGGTVEQRWGPSLMTVDLGADFRIAHCAAISFGPTRGSPSRLLPVRRFPSPSLPTCCPAEKNPPPHLTRLRTRLSKRPPQREVFERVAGEIPGGTVELKLGSPLGSRLSSGLDRNRAHCARISFWPCWLFTLAASSRRRFSSPSRPACCPAEKNPPPPHTRLRIRLSKRPPQREVFERGNWGDSLAGRSNRNWGPLCDHG